MKREYPEQPIAGVGGVIFNNDSVLLVKRNQSPGKGDWSFPGGVVELGEGLEEALKREIMEEVSVTVKIRGIVGVFDRIILDTRNRIRYHYVIIDYWGSLISGIPVAGSDVNDARFVNLSKVSDFKVSKEVADTILLADRLRKSP
ncbi:MAG: NUDIX hydrolase [Deltaproteobacteria bacterium]|nr:NUDIX hydrolase [Deltaproteobacteria bacterium]